MVHAMSVSKKQCDEIYTFKGQYVLKISVQNQKQQDSD